jgi:hypothetical protein
MEKNPEPEEAYSRARNLKVSKYNIRPRDYSTRIALSSCESNRCWLTISSYTTRSGWRTERPIDFRGETRISRGNRVYRNPESRGAFALIACSVITQALVENSPRETSNKKTPGAEIDENMTNTASNSKTTMTCYTKQTTILSQTPEPVKSACLVLLPGLGFVLIPGSAK